MTEIIKEIKTYITPARVEKLIFYSLYLFIGFVLQEIVLGSIRIHGVDAFILPVMIVCIGIFEDAVIGTVSGLILGIFTEYLFIESTITFVLLFPLLGFLSGFLTSFFFNKSFISYMIISCGAMLFTGAVQLVKVMMVCGFSFELIVTLILQTLMTMPLAVLCWIPVNDNAKLIKFN